LAHWCFQKFGIFPRDFLKLDLKTKAFIAASIEVVSEEEKKAKAKMKKK
jgi:hypothetical protein